MRKPPLTMGGGLTALQGLTQEVRSSGVMAVVEPLGLKVMPSCRLPD